MNQRLIFTLDVYTHKQIIAHEQVAQAVKLGQLKKKPCMADGCRSQAATQAHHTDYNKPLDVVWLCGSCHSRVTNRCVIKSGGQKIRQPEPDDENYPYITTIRETNDNNDRSFQYTVYTIYDRGSFDGPKNVYMRYYYSNRIIAETLQELRDRITILKLEGDYFWDLFYGASLIIERLQDKP